MSHEHESPEPEPRPGASRWRAWALKVVLPSAIALAVGTAVAVGLPASNPGVITACVNTNLAVEGSPVGAVRIINTATTATTTDIFGDSPSACSSNETTLTWNAQGATGPQGATGAQGAAGSQGATGSQGAAGSAGSQGVAGPQGLAGADGQTVTTTSGQTLTSYGPDLGPGEAAYLQIENNDGSSALKGESQAGGGYSLTTATVARAASRKGVVHAPAGETTDTGLTGETGGAASLMAVPLNGFAFSVQNVLNISSQTTGTGAGKITFNPLVITRAIDASSPTLFLNSASGGTFKQMLLSVVKTSGKTPYIVEQWQFALVAVKQIDFTPTLETDTFEYGAVRFITYQQKPDGTLQTSNVGSWSRVNNDTSVGLALPVG